MKLNVTPMVCLFYQEHKYYFIKVGIDHNTWHNFIMFFIKADHLPKELTSYDLLKTLAVILMIIDHVGAYIAPDQTWWRLASSSMPIWFFFVGYANSRNITPPLWGGMLLLVMANILLGGSVVPLSILGTIILVRLVLDPVMKVAMTHVTALISISFVCLLLWYPTRIFAEYGTLALLMAMYGWMVRHEKTDKQVKRVLSGFMLFAIIAFIGTHFAILQFSTAQGVTFVVTTLCIFIFTLFFKPATLPNLTKKLPHFIVSSLQIMGRYSLYLYVGHVIIFMIIAYFLGTKEYELLNWRLLPFK